MSFWLTAACWGVRWGGQERTQDIDFAHAGKAISLVLPSDLHVKTDAAIESLNMGFLPVAGLSGAYLIPNEPSSGSISSRRCIAAALRRTCTRC